LLKERIHVTNPFTRNFLVGWIILLDSIPDLELVTFLPEFLGGLFKFLGDPNRDVHVATQGALERFLNEIKRISRIKKGIEESRKSRSEGRRKRSGSVDTDGSMAPDADDDSAVSPDDKDASSDDDWIPGQDVQVNHKDILEILTANLDSTSGTFSNIIIARLLTSCRGGCPLRIVAVDCRVPGHLPGRCFAICP
jgi:vacuole morphology and inheritance protein 14